MGSFGVSNVQFAEPWCIAIAGDLIYITDYGNHRVQIFDGATRNYIATLGTTGSAGASNTQFNYPFGVAVSTDNRIYVADYGNHRVQIFDGATRNYITTVGTTGSAGASNTKFSCPTGVAVSADNRIYVADHSNDRVQIFDGATRNYIATLGTTGSAGASNTQFNYPFGVAVSTDNRIYVADYGNHRVQIFDGATRNYIATLGTTGSAGTSNTKFRHPTGVAVSADNHIYVADSSNDRVQIFDGATRNYIDTLGTLGTTGSAGTSNTTEFSHPTGVAVSPSGDRLYVIDSDNHRVQIFDNKA